MFCFVHVKLANKICASELNFAGGGLVSCEAGLDLEQITVTLRVLLILGRMVNLSSCDLGVWLI